MLNVPWQDCVEFGSCPKFSLCMACVESMVLALHGENQGFWCEACNIWLPPHYDVHVHQPVWNHWWFLRHVGRIWWWKVLITYNLVLFRQYTFGLIITNLENKRTPSKYGMLLNLFAMDALQVACSFFTHSNHIMGWMYVVHVHAKLWIVGICQVSHLNQNKLT